MFDHMLPELRALIAEDQTADKPATKRITLGLYSLVAEPAEKPKSSGKRKT